MMIFFFFLKDYDDFFFEQMMMVIFLKMNEPWVNAPSLEHEFMSLEKNLI